MATLDGAKFELPGLMSNSSVLARMIEASRLYHTFGNIDGKSMCCACFPERSSSWSEWKRSTQAIALLSRDRLTMSHDAVSQF